MNSCNNKSIICAGSKLKLPSSTTSSSSSSTSLLTVNSSDDFTGDLTINNKTIIVNSATFTASENNEEDSKKNFATEKDSTNSLIHPRIYYISGGDNSYSRFKTRSICEPRNEYQMARGGISGDRGRRGGGGGGGGGSSTGGGGGGGGNNKPRAFKKSVDRDSNVDGFTRSKFQESLKNHENKYYDDKRSNDDSRVSKLLRRLCREDDYDHFLTLCKQLQEAISAQENQRYIRRSLDIICENLFDLLHNGPSTDAKMHVAKCLGRVGYVADQDFQRYMDWIFNKYSCAAEYKDSNNIKCLLMKAFGETLKFDVESLKLKDHSKTIMSQLQSILEDVIRPDLLIATVDLVLIMTDSYPDSFVHYFRNTVDILVGWHIDCFHQKSLVAYASRSLQRFRSFWIADLPFTLTLLGQFLEDMENYDEELSMTDSGRSTPGSGGEPDKVSCPRECVLKMTAVVAVFNTVMRCVKENLSPNLTPSIEWSFIMECLSKMLKMVVKVIELDDSVEFLNSNESGLSQENIDSLIQSMKNINISQKNIDILVRNLYKNDEVNEEKLIKLIKYLNIKKNDKKYCKLSDKDRNLTLSKEKEESLINLIKSMDLKLKNDSDLSEEKEELVMVANECTSLLLGLLQSRVSKSHDLLYKFIDLQLQRVDTYCDNTIVSMLNTISKVIKEVSANLPLNLVHNLLGKNSVLRKLRFHNAVVIQNAVLDVYHSLLSLKNIPLLQEAYHYILADLENAFKVVVPISDEPLVSDNPFTEVQYQKQHAEILVIFLLRALSNIANASNSIIGMWALKPSILEFLAVKLKPHNSILAQESPFLQYHILFLLYSHCSRYSHFVTSSILITGINSCCSLEIFPCNLEVPTGSPTSGHLSIILNLIAEIIENKKTTAQTLLLSLEWIQDINSQAKNYMEVLSKTDECKVLISSLLICGASTNHKISLAVCKNLKNLVRAKQVYWPYEVYSNIIDLAILHLTGSNKTIRESYGQLLMDIPLNIVLPKLNKAGLLSDNKKCKDLQNYSSEALVLSQRLHMRSNNNSKMQTYHFKTYMAFLLQKNHFDTCDLSEILSLSWPKMCDTQTVSKMFELGSSNLSFLYFWGGFEAAQYCVINKLRTPLGKPQETFTTIEGSLKQLAREISYATYPETTSKMTKNLNQLLQEHTRVRLLVEFLEHLERVIHNAAEGCAVALLPYSKPVRTFFHTNKSTCREWLNRIRLALCVVSLHAGLATNALRNSQQLLEDLSLSNNTQGPEFERATLCTARAMVMLGEAEALQGLYMYTKKKDRKFNWLKAAIDDAAGKHELAAENYHTILEEKILAQTKESAINGKIYPKNDVEDSHITVFCIERLSKCYYSLGAWKQLENWKNRETEILEHDKNAKNLCKQIFENIAPQQATCLRKFEEGEELTLEELSNWTLVDEEACTNWSRMKTMSDCLNTLTNIALRLHADDSTGHSFIENIKKCQKIAARIMEEGLRNVPSEYLNTAILLQFAATGLMNLLNPKSQSYANVFKLLEVDKVDQLSSSVLTQMLWWSDYFRRADRLASESAKEVDSLRLHVARSARKEGNFNLAQRELGKYFASECGLDIQNDNFNDFVRDIVSGIVQTVDIDWTKDNMKAFRETSKLLRDMGKSEEALKVCCITALGISKSIVVIEQDVPTELRKVGTKVLLTLGHWIQQDAKIDNNPQLEKLLYFESLHNDGLMNKLFGKTTELIPPSDVIVGKVLHLGVNQCPNLPASWSNFAGWCYKWGRKIVDNSNSGLLTDIDKTNIQSLLPIDITDADFNTVLSILGKKNRIVPEDEGDIDINDVNTSETIENLLRTVPILNGCSSQHLGMLVDIWRQAQSRIYAYYELSTNAYFKYLELVKDTNDCETITATLRLLRLVVKHASELQNVLESGLSTTPTGPWKEIIPQLFSRLSHPESYVRMRVSELLCRIAENSPHLITFPAVVGAVTCAQKNIEGAIYEKNSGSDEGLSDVDYFLDDDNDYGQDANQGMNACYAQLTECLSKSIPDSVYQVKILVRELRRITLLWDELWLAALCQHHSEITKRFEQLEFEVQKVQDNIWLSQEEKGKLILEKYRIILKPIVFILENLLAMTSVPAETPHEKNFQDKFGSYIEKVIEKLKNPKNLTKPQMAALPLKQLESKLAKKIQKRAYSLSMSDISPTLAKFKDTCIAMPGICTTKMVTIKFVDNHIQILPTKTKPKKLIFHGSDGQVYTYLFKGLEDLHLDERIMQFLSICNTMMSKNNDDSDKKMYQARHYSVIPLGPRSGLIQWVDGVTPLFALYKRWQQRESSMTNKSSGSTMLRPSELFYSKLTPLLKERGIAIDNRKEWPLPILKQVLTELMAETPKDLLAKEIWCNSLNAGSWWQATKNYSYSVAVMSIIGYIIGLGDRHLDNVLIDLNTGEIVHIDYNVCFEKGKTLRVPEKVPFRMTPNITTALGVTGVEGIFRLACEHTLRVMRRGRETLLTLLEAFVYDPLVDWRAGADSNTLATYGACQARAKCNGIGRKQLESELTFAMFAVRIAEMKTEWLTNKDELAKSFPAICHRLNRLIETYEGSRQCQESLQDRHRQLALVKEAQAMGRSHPLFTLAKRYNALKYAKEVREKAEFKLKERITKLQKQINSHNLTLNVIRGPQLRHWISEINSLNVQEDHLVFDLVKDFLQKAGQSQMIVQCEQSENELTQIAAQHFVLLSNCIDLLSQYSTICNMYPFSHLSKHRSIAYHDWLSKLLYTGTTEACTEVLAQFNLYFAPVTASNSKVQQALKISKQIEDVLRETTDNMDKSYKKMLNQGLPEALTKIENAYVESKNSIATFLTKENGADMALECANITMLCSLNKKYLTMEAAAKNVGESLADLTSRDSDWYFLDEMRLMSSLITEFISFIPENHNSNNEPNIDVVIKCLKSADNIQKSLQELNYNFHTIILPEAMKTIISEESTVMRMINDLDEIIESTGFPLMEIMNQLEEQLRIIILKTENPKNVIHLVVDTLRTRFEALLSRSSDSQEINEREILTPGQMLLMGFNGLFEKIQMEGNALISTLNALEIPTSWRKIDEIIEAKKMSALIFNESAQKIFEDMFLIKRLNMIQKFFWICKNAASVFRNESTNIYMGSFWGMEKQLSKFIRLFIADYVSRQLIGLTSQSLGIVLCFLLQRMGLNVTTEVEQRDFGAESRVPLEELCNKVVDTALKRGLFNESTLTQANALHNVLETCWRRKESAKATQQVVDVARATVQRLQLQLTAHFWLHEDYLHTVSHTMSSNMERSTFVFELRTKVANLSNFQTRLDNARQLQQNLVISVGQRLKWAAGANPALSEVMAAFDNAVLISCEKLTHMANLSDAVLNTCNTILHYELLRTRTEDANAHDATFVKLVKLWEESCLLTKSVPITMSQDEEGLVELLQIGSDDSIDVNWLRQTEKIVSDAIVEAQKKSQEQQDSLVSNQFILKEQVMMLQSIIANHHKLMNDVRMLLKSMAKQENIIGLQEFLMNYRSCTESLSATVKELDSDNLDSMKAAVLKMELEVLAAKIPALYDELLSFAKETINEYNVPEFSFNKTKLIRKNSVCFSPRKGVTPARDPTTGKAVQERNAYALNVWRRVRMKLEGRDPNPNRKYTTAEQVEYVIREAQSTDNLALLYEGWTPWV